MTEKQIRVISVSYPESAEYQGVKELYTKNGCNTDKMTVPYYAEFPYDPDKEGASLNNFDQNQKVELGTYTYKQKRGRLSFAKL